MSQATNINVIPSSSELTDLLLKSHVVVDAIKKENEENKNHIVAKTRRGKKNELMPTGSKIVELQEFATKKSEQKSSTNIAQANNQQSNNSNNNNDNSVDGTSIWFRLAALYVNNLMQTNQLEMSADAVALQANQKAMELVQQGFNKLNEDMSKPVTQDSNKAHSWLGGMIGGGVAAVVLGVVIITVTVALALLAAPITGGMSLSVGAMVIGSLLVAGGIAMPIVGGVTYQQDKNNPGKVPGISYLIDDMGGEDPAKLAMNQSLEAQLSGFSSIVNNNTNENMQTLQNTNSLLQQYSTMFSQMMNYYSSSMGR